MHHAFPRECPFPHVSDTTYPVTTREWKERTGLRATLDEAGLRSSVEAYDPSFDALALVDLGASGDDFDAADEVVSWTEPAPWTDHEELVPGSFDGQAAAATTGGLVRVLGRTFIMVLAVGGMLASLLWNLRNGQRNLGHDHKKVVV